MSSPSIAPAVAPSGPGTVAEKSSKHALFEPIALVLLSLATIGTAWCSFQAASWQGVSQQMMNLSAASNRQAAKYQLQATQFGLLDVMLFSQYVNARMSSNDAAAGFYADRFRSESKTAFQTWLASAPFENSNAFPHPFVPALYQPKLMTDAAQAEEESQTYWQKAGEAGRAGRGYILITVLLACALFCGGTAARFEAAWIRRTVMGVGLLAFAFALGRLLVLPVKG